MSLKGAAKGVLKGMKKKLKKRIGKSGLTLREDGELSGK